MRNLIVIIIILTFAASMTAEVYLNGSYESSLEIQRDDWAYKWRMYNPWHRIELRFYANPLNDTDIYIKTGADGNMRTTEYTERPDFQEYDLERRDHVYLEEGHLRYKIGQKDSLETYLLAREVRFWLGDPLLFLVSTDDDKWDWRNVTGATTELNGGIENFYMKFFLARMYYINTDAAGVRLHQKIVKDVVHSGATVTYKNWHMNKESYNLVYAADTWVNLFSFQWTTEVAQSKTQFIEEDLRTVTTNMENSTAVKSELRKDLDLNSIGIGDFSLIASVRDIGEKFRASLSKKYDNDQDYDQQGIYFENKYKIPRKAITLTYHWDYYKKHVENFHETENYAETYIEFVKGFRWKNWYKINHEVNEDKIEITDENGMIKEVNSVDNKWQHVLTQLEMENQLAYVKLQFKIKNMFTDYLKHLYGIEYSIKITEKLRSINRLVICDEQYRLRKTFFSQLQFLYWENTYIYLSYGDEWDSNDDLVNDDASFVETDKDITHVVRLYLKVDF